MHTATSMTQPPALGEISPQDVYLPEVLAIAREERASMQPNLNRVLRPDVLAVWDSWYQSGVPVEKIGLRTYNGLINVTAEEVTRHLARHRQGALTTIVTRLRADNPPPTKGATMSNTPDITFDQWQATRAQSNGAAVSTKVDTPAISPTKGELLVLDPTAVYPAEVIRAAKEQEASDGRRDLTKILTDDVLAIWHRWNTEGGISMAAIGKKRLNGLIDVHLTQVSAYLVKYRERLAVAELAEPPADEPVATVETTTASNTTADVRAQTIAAEPDSVPAAEAAPAPAATSPGRKAVVVKKAIAAEPAADEPPAPALVEEPETAAIEPVPEPVSAPAAEATAADPLPKPEIEPLETAVAAFEPHRPENLPPWLDRQWAPPPAPRPGDALGALVQLLNDERITVKGSVKLNIEIEFGG